MRLGENPLLTAMQHPESVPQTAASLAAPYLLPGETVVASMTVDLSDQLRFIDARLVLTESRLLMVGHDGAIGAEWALDEPAASRLSLRHTDHGGVGTLELHDESQRLAQWRFTLEHNVLALRLLSQFEQQQARRALPPGAIGLEAGADEAALCPS
jgi:ATP-binding cassette subfamily B protein